jgi:DNA-binding MltR family transcriptional regulator
MASANTPQLSDFLNQVDAESDRGVALLAASFVNAALRNCLLDHFTHAKPGRELLDDSNGPLAGLSAAAKACRALDIITDSQYERILIIRTLRNDFAHSWQPLDFSMPGVRKTLRQFNMTAGSSRGLFIAAVSDLLRELGVMD